MAASSVAGTKRGGSSGASLARTQLRPRRGPYVSVRPARTFWPGAPAGHAGARTGADHDQPLPGHDHGRVRYLPPICPPQGGPLCSGPVLVLADRAERVTPLNRYVVAGRVSCSRMQRNRDRNQRLGHPASCNTDKRHGLLPPRFRCHAKAPAACCNTLWPGPPECDYPSLIQITFRDRRGDINHGGTATIISKYRYRLNRPSRPNGLPDRCAMYPARRASDSYAASSSWGTSVFAAKRAIRPGISPEPAPARAAMEDTNSRWVGFPRFSPLVGGASWWVPVIV